MVRYDGAISFADSLKIMHIRDVPGAYGVDTDEYGCEMCWSAPQREGWLQELINAQIEVEKELGDHYLTPREICGEIHHAAHEVALKRPIYALGRWAYTEWQSVELSYSPEESGGFLDASARAVALICDELLIIDDVTYSVDDIEFDWPDEIVRCYDGIQEVHAPCNVGHESEMDGCAGGGYRFEWYVYQMLSPLLPPVAVGEDGRCADLSVDNYITSIRFRFRYVDDTAAVTLVGQCLCGSGCDTGSVTAEIVDASEGIICLSGSVCGSNSRVRIDYISSYRCASAPDPVLKKAVTVLAIVMAGDSIAKPCECDNTWLDQWTQEDTSTRGEMSALRLHFGNTKGGMFVQRTIIRYLTADREKKSRTMPLTTRASQKRYLQRF